MTFAEKGGGGSRNAGNLRINSVDFADIEAGGGQKFPKFCGRHKGKPPTSENALFKSNVTRQQF